MEDAQQGIYKLREAMKLANQGDFYSGEEAVNGQMAETRPVEPINRM